MKISTIALILVMLSSLPLACQKTSPPKQAPSLADGIYLVLRHSETRDKLLPLKSGESLVVQDQTFGGADPGETPVYLVLDRSSAVPLILQTTPEQGKGEEGKAFVQLTLSNESGKAFEKLTGDNLGRTAAVVIGQKAVSKHKIRVAIAGGHARISCCGAGTCEFLFAQLRDNIVPEAGR